MNSLNLIFKFNFSAFILSALLGSVEARVIDKIVRWSTPGSSYQVTLTRD